MVFFLDRVALPFPGMEGLKAKNYSSIFEEKLILKLDTHKGRIS